MTKSRIFRNEATKYWDSRPVILDEFESDGDAARKRTIYRRSFA